MDLMLVQEAKPKKVTCDNQFILDYFLKKLRAEKVERKNAVRKKNVGHWLH